MVQSETAYLYGADSVIGQEICMYLLEKGIKVVAQFFDAEQMEQLINQIPLKTRPSFHPVYSELKNLTPEKITKHVNSIFMKYPEINLYIHAQPWLDEMEMLDQEQGILANHVEQQLLELFLYCQAFARFMIKKKNGQLIVPLLSDALYYSEFPSSPIYNSGASALVKSLAKEFSPFGVCVNIFELGFFQLNETKPLSRKERKKFDIYAMKPPVPSMREAVSGLGILIDYGKGMSGQTISYGYGIPTV